MDIKGKHITVLGAVRSGLSAAKLALDMGAIPFVSDFSNTEDVLANTDKLKKLGISCETGGHSPKVYECDLIVTSPGVPSDSNIIIEAKNHNIKIISEIEFASWFCKGNIIAITGTNGKTTTTSLCSHVLNSSGVKCYLAGNIGLPFSDIVLDIKEDEFVALEVSSFQLDFIDQFKPKYSVLLNITPDHLDRYKNRFDLYIKSKMKIVENQSVDDVFVYNGDDANIPIGLVSSDTELLAFSLDKELRRGSFVDNNWVVSSVDNGAADICNVNDLTIKGEHNLQNSLAVINIAKHIGISNKKLKQALASFKGVEHRLEFVRELNGIKFINDSKATNVDSVWYALRSFNQPIYLILGGKDKGNDYSQISDEVRKRVKKIYAIGSSAGKVYDYFRNITEVEKVESLHDSVLKGLKEAPKESVLLLSPACASFDMFKNYEDRGSKFKKIVNELV